MDTEQKEILQETFDKLPQDIKDTIFSDDYQRLLNEAATAYSLTPEQANTLQLETTEVLMGESTRGEYRFNLESEVGLDEDTAEDLSKQMNNIVFAVVKDSLDKMDQAKRGTEEELNKKLDYDEKKDAEENPEDAPKTDTSLNSLSDRLKQATIAAPKQNYGAVRTTAPAPVDLPMTESNPSLSSGPAAIDPYHEPIDNE